MGMTPLHILCCNPSATTEMIQAVVEGEPSSLTQTDVTGSTPLQLFLKCKSLMKANEESILTIFDVLERGIQCDDYGTLHALNRNR